MNKETTFKHTNKPVGSGNYTSPNQQRWTHYSIQCINFLTFTILGMIQQTTN